PISPEYRLALTVARCAVPAFRAGLRRVRSIDLLDPARGLVFQPGHQQAPAVVEDGPIQPGLLPHLGSGLLDGALRGAGHASHVEVFDTDGVVATREPGRCLLHPILT